MPEQARDRLGPSATGPTRIRWPLSMKALLLVLTTALVPLAILGTIGVNRASQSVIESERENLKLIANLTATRLDQLFVDTKRMQGMIAANRIVENAITRPDPDGASLRSLQEMLDEIVQGNPDLALLYAADAQGICIASTSPDMVGRDYRSTREYMRRALAGEEYVSDLNMGITTGEPGVFFSGPVHQGQAIVGAVVLKLKGSVLDRICGDVGGNVLAGIVDGRQVVISHPEKEKLYHSIGALSSAAATQINPKLDYGVDEVRSLGLEEVSGELAKGFVHGNLTFAPAEGDVSVVGYSRLQQKPWSVIIVQSRNEFIRPVRELAYTYIAAFAAVGLISGALATFTAWRLLRPVKALRDAAQRASRGDWSARAKVMSHDELGDLANSFNEMMPRLEQQAKTEHALKLAMEVQRHLLPEHGPKINGIDVDGVNVAADETGGDYFDFLDLSSWRNGALAVAIGDVTGHGISAALLMATARGMVRSQATPPGCLAQLMTNVNEHLCKDLLTGQFMTLMYAVIERPSRRVRLASAGHDPILEYRPGEGTFRELAGSDMPLGVECDWKFNEHEYVVADDSILVFGTDGIWETFSPAGDQFGTERLKDVIRANAGGGAREIKQAILDAVNQFRGPRRQSDDVTVVVVKFSHVDAPIVENTRVVTDGTMAACE